MEFSLYSFTTELIYEFVNSNLFPYMWNEEVDSAKHKKRTPLHLRSAVNQDIYNNMVYGENKITFDIGSERLERTHPYYHILQQARVIRKRNRGTKKTLGSQATISDVGKRDYEKVSWNGKTFTKEYSRNVRGKRNRITSVSHWTEDYAGNDVFVNRNANAYYNKHYKYIDEILDGGMLDRLAREYNLIKKRKQDSGLGEEYALQPESEFTTNFGDLGLADIISSFME